MSEGAVKAGRRRRLDSEARRVKVRQRPWSPWRNGLKPLDPLSADAIEALHRASLDILGNVGVAILLPEARVILAGAGCSVDEDNGRVRFGRELVEAMLALAPSRVALHARNPAHGLVLGGEQVCVATCVGPPNGPRNWMTTWHAAPPKAVRRCSTEEETR